MDRRRTKKRSNNNKKKPQDEETLTALHGSTSIRAMSFCRLHYSQFDAFVSNFVHEFNWFLIRSIYSCHVSLIIIGQATCFALTDWYDLNTLMPVDFWGPKANDFHVNWCYHETQMCLVKSFTTNGTCSSAAEVFSFIESPLRVYKKKYTCTHKKPQRLSSDGVLSIVRHGRYEFCDSDTFILNE